MIQLFPLETGGPCTQAGLRWLLAFQGVAVLSMGQPGTGTWRGMGGLEVLLYILELATNLVEIAS